MKDLKQKFSAKQVTELEDAILKELVSSEQQNIEFSDCECVDINENVNMVVVQCSNLDTFKWLKTTVPHLKAWKGPILICRMEKYLPRYHEIEFVLPNSEGKTAEELFELMEIQNKGLFTHKWIVEEQIEEEQYVSLKVKIDHVSAVYFVHNNNSFKYRFGIVNFEGLENIWDVPIVVLVRLDYKSKESAEGEEAEEHNGEAEDDEEHLAEDDSAVEEVDENDEPA